ncbi:MAG: ABC transporter permease [Acetivibrionales bacterium]|jgi:peptide/nickel transport system permease protein
MNNEKTRFSRLKTIISDNKVATIAAIYFIIILIISFLAPILPFKDPNDGSLINSLVPPGLFNKESSEFLLGTDRFGRDILSRIFYGARASLSISLISTVLSMVIGTVLGMLSGYIRSFDTIITRIVDVELAFPSIVLSIVMVAALGGSSVINLIIVLTIRGWVQYTRIVRSVVLTLRESLLIESCRCIGASKLRIIFVHILPNVISSSVAVATIQFPQLIIQESSLSFMGLGIPITVPSWGGMLEEGQQVIYSAWWPVVFPALAIGSVVFAGVIVGNKISRRFERT